MEKSDIGLIGLAVMGENLALNMESKGFRVSVFDREQWMIDGFMEGRGKGGNFFGPHSFQEFIDSIRSPRKIMMMIRAGQPVDDYIARLIPMLDPGDIIIDGGNTHFPDTQRRVELVESKGLRYIGTGVSGGEEGALKGPSMMPGGSPSAWPEVKPIFQAICAKVGDEPCCDWVGDGGAGHFVKMVHNGIEYGDIQLICECYHIMKSLLGMTNSQMHEVFSRWNEGDLDSYLVSITKDILAKKDEDGGYVLDKILDTAGQKGTGKWTAISSLDEGVPLTLITESVFARCLSALKEERVEASKVLAGPASDKNPDGVAPFAGNRDEFLEDLRKALFASKIISYAQGFSLIRAAAADYGWKLNYGGIALMWRGGCIIRSTFLGKIKEAFDNAPQLPNIMLDPYFASKLAEAQAGWRRVLAAVIAAGIPAPCLSAAIGYYDSYRCDRLPANLLQAQRDYFGAHTYERCDRPRGEFFHTNWTGNGGDTTSGSYNV